MGSPIPTRIKFKHYIKAIEKIASQKYERFLYSYGSGSSRRFDLFLKKSDTIATKMWTAHEDKFVWSGDLKKACDALEFNKKDFQKLVDSF